MAIMFWVLLSSVFAMTLLGARRIRGADMGHIDYRLHDVIGVAMIGGMICVMLLLFAMR